MRIVMIAGYFDPFQDGHLYHVKKAMELAGPEGVVVVSLNTDENKRKYKKKEPNIPEDARIEIVSLILSGLSCQNFLVVKTVGKHGTQEEMLEKLKPAIFLKGGDWTPENLPESEKAVCEKYGIKIMHDGGPKIRAGRDMEL